MLPLASLKELYDYNYWARDQQLAACEGVSPENFLRPLGSSWSSLRDTLVHLLGVEWVWLERCRGYSPTAQEAEQYAPEKFTSVAAVRNRWGSVERDLRAYLASLSEEALARPLTYTNLKGQSWTYPLGKVLLHVINHQTYHRGQITTMLRQVGARPVPIDYLVFLDARAGK